MKKLGLWLMTVCLLVCSAFAVACKEKGTGGNGATVQEYVTLSQSTLSLEVYSQDTLTATTNADGAIIWTTSDETVATVEGGVVSALSVGSATITATAGTASATCTLTVTPLSNFPELVVSDTSLALVEGGDSITVSASANYKGEAIECDFTWESADPAVATVENGRVTPVAFGSTTVTVTTVCLGELLVKEISVVVSPDEQIQLSKGVMELTLAKINAGDVMEDTLSAQAYKEGEVNAAATLTFETSDAAVALVAANGNQATVTAVGLGSCVISVYYDSDKGRIESFVEVTVSRSEVALNAVTDISYEGENTALDVGSFDLVGEFDGVYANGELVSAADGRLTKDFVETNKNGFAVDVELRTDVAVYYTQIAIVIDYMQTAVIVGETSEKLPAYEGDLAAIGFAEGDSVYTYTVTDNDAAWTNRLSPYDVAKVPSFDHWIVEFSLDKEPTGAENSGQIMTVWAGTSHLVVVRVVNMAVEILRAGNYAGSEEDHKAEPCVSIYGEDGKIPVQMKANKKYYFEMHFAHAESGYYALSFNDALNVYVGDSFFCTDAYYSENIAPNRDNSAPETPDVSVQPDPTLPDISQGDNRTEMPTYDGDVTALGFPAGTETVYAVDGSDGWGNRIIMKVDPAKDYLKFDLVPSTNISNFTVWPANSVNTFGSYSVTGISASTTDGDADRNFLVLDKDGKEVAKGGFTAGELYTVYVQLIKETNIQCGVFTSGAILYIANVASVSVEDMPIDPDAPVPPISQGEARNEMPTYGGDVTALGFAAGTVVYQIVGPQSNASDVKLVAQVDSTGDNAYAKLDFVLSAPTTSLGLWITAANSHLGYYTVTPTGFTADGIGDPSRTIFVTDANGEKVSTFEANKVYTLYVGLDGREVTVQVTTWANLTMYVANIACITEAEAPVEPAPPVQGKEISILFIGNSFSDDTEAYMVDILLNLGYTNINIGNLYIGGCSIDTHYANIMNNASAYDFRMRSHNGVKYTEYESVTVGGKKKSIAFAIAYKDWDIISVQQASGESGKADTYKNLDALVAEVKKQATNSAVEIVFNMTWAYQGDSTHAQFPDYNSDQMTMYNAIVGAVQAQVKYTVVPNGTAIQNARTSLLGDHLTRDGYHLDLKIGRFIAGLTFVAKVTGADITDFAYAPGGINDLQFAIAIESVQNALETPFAITQSKIEEEVVEDPDVTSGGSNATAVTVYKGDETALGFAEGTTVYQYVGVDSTTDKAAIKVDSTKYDYVDVQFVIAKGDGYFFLHGLKGGNWYNSGISYVIDPSWMRLGDGKNTASDRVIEVFDAAGNKVTTLMKTNVLYTLRVFIKVGELDEIRISKNGSTIYFANVTQGLESDLSNPEPSPGTTPVVDYKGNVLNIYKGDETALGFAEDTTVYEYVQDNRTDNWTPGTDLGLTMEQQTIMLTKGGDEDYVSIYFSLSRDLTNGYYAFFAWWFDANNVNKGGAGYLNASGGFTKASTGPDGFKVIAYDMDGNEVTSFKANTLYEMRWYGEGVTAFKIGCCEKNGETITVYYANPSHGNDEA